MTTHPPAGDLTVTGRILRASNGTYVGHIDDVEVVYKPVSGEQPLWDFPDGRLAWREVAAHAVSQWLGWEVVPPTWLQDGPLGPGMVQRWQTTDPEVSAVDVVAVDAVPGSSWLHVLDAYDEHERPVSLVHEDTAALRRLAVFDVICNNADRKGSHVLVTTDGRRLGVDHGLTFHVAPKLRTVLWGWIDDPIGADDLADVERLHDDLASRHASPLRAQLEEWLLVDEVDALRDRCAALLRRPMFPGPIARSSPVPWPLF